MTVEGQWHVVDDKAIAVLHWQSFRGALHQDTECVMSVAVMSSVAWVRFVPR
jgi:hypothetical protein